VPGKPLWRFLCPSRLPPSDRHSDSRIDPAQSFFYVAPSRCKHRFQDVSFSFLDCSASPFFPPPPVLFETNAPSPPSHPQMAVSILRFTVLPFSFQNTSPRCFYFPPLSVGVVTWVRPWPFFFAGRSSIHQGGRGFTISGPSARSWLNLAEAMSQFSLSPFDYVQPVTRPGTRPGGPPSFLPKQWFRDRPRRGKACIRFSSTTPNYLASSFSVLDAIVPPRDSPRPSVERSPLACRLVAGRPFRYPPPFSVLQSAGTPPAILLPTPLATFLHGTVLASSCDIV